MKWYPYLYVGEGASKKKNKIIRKLKIGAGMIDVWVITEAANGEDQFDILSSAWLKQRAVRKKLPMIYGIAKGYEEAVDLDGLNYLAGKDMDFVNKSAMNGTILAHTDGSVPNLKVTIPAMDAYSLGQLFYFFEFACGVSGYLLGVNPFNQPGVESYKKNMFALLGKPGYEEAREALLKRL